MAKAVYDIWLEEGILDDNLKTMQGLISQGVRLDVIAETLEISEKTLQRMRKTKPDVREALRRGAGHIYGECGNFLTEVMRDIKQPIELRVKIANDLQKQIERGNYLKTEDMINQAESIEESGSIQRVIVYKPEGVD